MSGGEVPATPHAVARAAAAWYAEHGRRRLPWRLPSAGQYERVVSEFLLQRARVSAVEAFFAGFVEEFPSWRALRSSEASRLEEVLRPLGLHRTRAASLKAAAAALSGAGWAFPGERRQIEAIPGVGRYIASAVLLFCHGQPEPLIDGGVARLVGRCFGAGRGRGDATRDPAIVVLCNEIVAASPDAATINWAILDVAAAFCGKAPRCDAGCPLESACLY